MKKSFKLLLVICLIICYHNSFSMKINFHGSGGVSSSGGKNDICPNKSSGICATVEGPFWELVEAWWYSKIITTPITLENGTITVLDKNGKESVLNDQTILIKEGSILSVNSENKIIDIAESISVVE